MAGAHARRFHSLDQCDVPDAVGQHESQPAVFHFLVALHGGEHGRRIDRGHRAWAGPGRRAACSCRARRPRSDRQTPLRQPGGTHHADRHRLAMQQGAVAGRRPPSAWANVWP